MANAGLEGSVIINNVMDHDGAYGFNVQSEKYEDLVKAGILDPTKVTRTALENASSVAGLLLMTEALITDKPEEEKSQPALPPGGMGGMY